MEFQIKQYGSRVFVPIELTIPELKNDPFSISFLADTGTDRTTIGPLDATKINFSNLRKSYEPLIGIGGFQTCVYYARNVLFQLDSIDDDPIGVKLDKIDIIKPENTAQNSENPACQIPSLLGTDFLHLFKFTYNSHPKLELKNS